jgi:hypothetical protein
MSRLKITKQRTIGPSRWTHEFSLRRQYGSRIRRGPRRAAAEHAHLVLNAGADARCTAKLKRQVRKRFPCGIWRMNTVEWSGVNKEVPSRDFTMQEIELHSSHENWYLSTRPFSENKAKRPPGRSRRTQSQGDIGGIQVLPQEILIQIIRNLVPTGGIFHCASQQNKHGKSQRVSCMNSTDPSRRRIPDRM